MAALRGSVDAVGAFLSVGYVLVVGFRGWLSSLAASWGTGGALLAVLGTAALFGFLSARLSSRFYEGRDL